MPTPRFVVEPLHALTPEERRMLAELEALEGAAVLEHAPPFRLRILTRPTWPAPASDALPDGAPARLLVVEGRIRVLHRRYLAEIDPVSNSGWLYRQKAPGGVVRVLRLAESCQLPLVGGLPLHAAGVVLDGAGLAFFGPSGAGKSTLAATFDGPLLSDELVPVTGPPFRLWGTGFWGDLAGRKPSGNTALTALFELRKGPAFSAVRLDPRAARQRLLEAVLVPPEARLWSAALAAIGRLVEQVPTYAMAWSPATPPWADLRRFLARRQAGDTAA